MMENLKSTLSRPNSPNNKSPSQSTPSTGYTKTVRITPGVRPTLSKISASMDLSDEGRPKQDTVSNVKLDESRFTADIQSFINDSLIESQFQKSVTSSGFIHYLQPEIDFSNYAKLRPQSPSLIVSLKLSTSKSYFECENLCINLTFCCFFILMIAIRLSSF